MTAIDSAVARGASGQAEFDRMKNGYSKRRKAELLAMAEYYRSRGQSEEAREYEEQAEGIAQ